MTTWCRSSTRSRIFRAIPDAELAVVPGTSHGVTLEKPGVVNELVLDFLEHDAAPTILPLRRAVEGHLA